MLNIIPLITAVLRQQQKFFFFKFYSCISPPGNTSAVTTNFAFLRFLACHISRARGITSQSLKHLLLKIEELLLKYFHCKSSYWESCGNTTAVSWVTSTVLLFFFTFAANTSVVCRLTAFVLRILTKALLEMGFRSSHTMIVFHFFINLLCVSLYFCVWEVPAFPQSNQVYSPYCCGSDAILSIYRWVVISRVLLLWVVVVVVIVVVVVVVVIRDTLWRFCRI